MTERSLRVLLAEDNPVNQALLTHLLESIGHVVTLAEHGAQALELVASSDFDIALMDMQMPVMDGETATRLIRLLPGDRAHLPVVALTAESVEHRERYMEAGLTDFLCKPITMTTLANTLASLTGAQRMSMVEDVPAPPPAESGLPVLDSAYMDDMRQWVGDATALTLLAAAPESFRDELAAITAAWGNGDEKTVRENAHRLKGAAGSIGCRRLADAAQALQKTGALNLADRAPLDHLTQEVAAAIDAAAAWRPA